MNKMGRQSNNNVIYKIESYRLTPLVLAKILVVTISYQNIEAIYI